jgi:FkbM family methyltransferase
MAPGTARRLRDLMTPASRLRYLIWRALPLTKTIKVKLATGEILISRNNPMTDLGNAWEVFVAEPYRPPKSLDTASIRRIVDIGANVGYTVVYWGIRFPAASIDAFEPHPVHLRLLKKNINANSLEHRVSVHAVGIGTADGQTYLSDEGTSSRVCHDGGAFQIDVVDFFKALSSTNIDLLKMDCEGAEYDIVMDPRFEQLNIGTLVMEWHAGPERPHAGVEICGRLRQLGWSLDESHVERVGEVTSGIVWGYRAASARAFDLYR